MNRAMIAGLTVVLLLPAACATTTVAPSALGERTCDAAPTQQLVGQTVTQALGVEAMRLSGAEILRWIPPNSAVTMDYRQNRLNVSYDENALVTDINCG